VLPEKPATEITAYICQLC